MNEMTLGIFVDSDVDEIALKFHDIGSEIEQHKLAQYLHPRLFSIKQNIPTISIQVSISENKDLFVRFTDVGDFNQRLNFEKFLYNWLPNAMKDFEETAE